MHTIQMVITIAIVMGLSLYTLRGIRKYNVTSFVKLFSKKEVAFTLMGFFLLFLVVIFGTARVTLVNGKGIISECFNWGIEKLFNGEAVLANFFFFFFIIAISVFYQSMIMSKVATKLKVPYMRFFFFVFMYVINPALILSLKNLTSSHLIMMFIIIWAYSVLYILKAKCGKLEIIVNIAVFSCVVALLVLEKKFDLEVACVYLLTSIESLLLAFYQGKAIILRKIFKHLGTLILMIGFMVLNYSLYSFFM